MLSAGLIVGIKRDAFISGHDSNMSLTTSVPLLGSHMNRHRVHIQNRDAILHKLGIAQAPRRLPSLVLFLSCEVSDILERSERVLWPHRGVR